MQIPGFHFAVSLKRFPKDLIQQGCKLHQNEQVFRPLMSFFGGFSVSGGRSERGGVDHSFQIFAKRIRSHHTPGRRCISHRGEAQISDGEPVFCSEIMFLFQGFRRGSSDGASCYKRVSLGRRSTGLQKRKSHLFKNFWVFSRINSIFQK